MNIYSSVEVELAYEIDDEGDDDDFEKERRYDS